MGSRRRFRHASSAITAAALVLGVLAVVTTPIAPPAAAQARYVRATVRTIPATPQPGDDVRVLVRVRNCRPGQVETQLLITGADTTDGNSAVMASRSLRNTIMWRYNVEFTLTDAAPGWYGIRVRCGSYQPERVPMAGTTFAVGANHTSTFTVSPDRVAAGGTLTLSGTGCSGKAVQYSIWPYQTQQPTFTPDGFFATKDDGTWSGTVTLPADLDANRVVVSARCHLFDRGGEAVYLTYDATPSVAITR